MVPNDDVTSLIVNLELIKNQLRSLVQFSDFYRTDTEHFTHVRDAIELLSARVSQWQKSPTERQHRDRAPERRQCDRRAQERRHRDDRRAAPESDEPLTPP